MSPPRLNRMFRLSSLCRSKLIRDYSGNLMDSRYRTKIRSQKKTVIIGILLLLLIVVPATYLLGTTSPLSPKQHSNLSTDRPQTESITHGHSENLIDRYRAFFDPTSNDPRPDASSGSAGPGIVILQHAPASLLDPLQSTSIALNRLYAARHGYKYQIDTGNYVDYYSAKEKEKSNNKLYVLVNALEKALGVDEGERPEWIL
jgi:hypothetical protein